MKFIIGDILSPNEDESKSVVVCHQVNCMGAMGSGLAKQVRDKFPTVYQVYRDKCESVQDKINNLGNVQFCSCLDDYAYIIANIFGQYSYGRVGQFTDYDAIRRAFRTIHNAFPQSTIRIPYLMGCNRGGGDWAMVFGIIKEELSDMDVEIWRLPDEDLKEKG